jgi:hypothetical protein
MVGKGFCVFCLCSFESVNWGLCDIDVLGLVDMVECGVKTLAFVNEVVVLERFVGCLEVVFFMNLGVNVVSRG